MKKRLLILLLFTLIPTILFLFLTILNKIIITNKTDFSSKKNPQVLTNSQNQPLFASGNCNKDSDCFQTGCSSQICANHEIITTCEIVEFPEIKSFTCGCINNRCVWYR